MPSYVNPFTGQTVQPSQVGYEQLTLSQDTELQWPINGNNSLIVANIIEVDATVAGIDIYMPAATQVSTGQSILFKNIGSNTFTVVDFSGNTIIAIASGIAEYVYITDNTTEDGQWSTVTFGAGTSSANAAALAGYGLKPISTTLNQAYTITNYFSNATFSAANRASFAVWEGGVGTLTLPVSSVVGNDWFIMIRNNGSGILTINPQGSDVIDDGLTSQQLQISESLVMVANGSTGFNTFGYGQAVNFYFTILSKVVTGLGSTITLTASEASNVIQEYSGILAANTNIIFPSTVQLYTVTNLTTGSYDLTFGTGAVGAATVTIPQNQSLVLICDGTNVYNANSATISVLPSLTINPGSAAAPTLNFLGNTTTGLFQPASGQVGLALNGVEKLTLEGDGLHVVDGILGGTF
jgi:hypothetical protein